MFVSNQENNVVPQERRGTVNPQRGKCSSSQTNNQGKPQRGKTRRNPEKEYPEIANPKGDPNGRQTKLVPRRPQENSNEDPGGSNSEAPAKAKMNPQKGIYFGLTPKYDPSGHQKEINA